MNPRIPHHKVVMFHSPQLYLRVKHPLRFFVTHVHPLHSSMNQELFEKYICNQIAPMRKYDGAMCPSYRMKLKYPLPFSASYFQLITQQYESNCLKTTSIIKVAIYYEKYCTVAQRKPSHAIIKLMPFTVRKDEWNTKEDNGKSLKNALNVLRYAKTCLK